MVEEKIISGKNEKRFLMGNEAIAWGAIFAGCRYFFGYPITPQNEIGELFARELPRLGGAFVQVEAEMASIAALYGAATTGPRRFSRSVSKRWRFFCLRRFRNRGQLPIFYYGSCRRPSRRKK